MESNSSKITKDNKIYTTLDILQQSKPNQAIGLQTNVHRRISTKSWTRIYFRRIQTIYII